MNRPPLPRLPPYGSTDWGAQQFYRVLDEEERVARERKRLRAMGWRPPLQPADGMIDLLYRGEPSTLINLPHSGQSVGELINLPYREEPVFGDERDAYADLIERDLGLRRALDREARQRVGAQSRGLAGMHSSMPTTAGAAESTLSSTQGWTGGGRFGVPVPGSTTPASPTAGLPLQQRVSLTDQTERAHVSPAEEPPYPQVAFAPAVALGLLALGLGGGAYLAYDATNDKTTNRDPFDFNPDFDLGFGSSPRDIVPPPPQEHRDFDPEEAARIQRELGYGTPNIPPIVANPPESLPIQEEIIPNSLAGPDLLDPPRLPLWHENRKGGEPTRSLNNEVRAIGEAVAAHMGSPVKHSGGAQDYLGAEIKENYLKNVLTSKQAGGNYIDVSFMHPETLRALLIQTVSVRADGKTQTTREHDNNVRVIRNMGNGDILVLIPKPGPGFVLNHEALADFIRPILQELSQPRPPVDPRASNLPEDLWRMFLNRQ